MLPVIFGIVLLLFPFLLVGRFPKTRDRFLKVFILIIVYHTAVALITQYFKIFTQPLLLTIHATVALCVFIAFEVYKIDWKAMIRSLLSLDKGALIVVFLSVLYLYQIHYNYTGPVQTVGSYIPQQVKNFVYPFPYYSDEWVAVALIQKTIDTHTLPLTNPFFENAVPLLNFGFVFYAFWAAILLLLGLEPLMGYAALMMINSTVLLLVLYFFLRDDNVNPLPAAISVASALYIVNSANLPGLWYLIPMMTGLVPFFAALRFLLTDQWKWSLAAAAAAVLFYPPLVLFYSAAFLMWGIGPFRENKKTSFKAILIYGAVIFLAAAIVSLSFVLVEKSYVGFLSTLIRMKGLFESFTGSVAPQYPIWVIVPPAILVLALVGMLWKLFSRFWLLASVFLGFAFWILYAQWQYRILVDYQRVIFITSLLLIFLSGYGLQWLVELLHKSKILEKFKVVEVLLALVVVIFFVKAFSYTQRDNWRKLKLVHQESGKEFMPAAPANFYLHPDDLRIFENLRGQSFLSLPWKGLVIGTATNNYPLAVKAGTITFNNFLYGEFMGGTCGKKKFLSKQYNFRYAYTPAFTCPEFDLIDVSKEGFVLYKANFK